MRIASKSIPFPIARDLRDASVSTARSGAAETSAPPSNPATTMRLQTIRAMLDRGEYPVDLDQLASRIVDDELFRAGRS